MNDLISIRARDFKIIGKSLVFLREIWRDNELKYFEEKQLPLSQIKYDEKEMTIILPKWLYNKNIDYKGIRSEA
jgi:hypothetical protein